MDKKIEETYAGIINSIVTVCSSQIDGVASVSCEVGSIAHKSKRKNGKSIIIDFVKNYTIIALSCNIFSGYTVPIVVCELQDKIKREVEKATPYKVKAVNVDVVGVVFPSY